MSIYKPLTPRLRENINIYFDEQISELQTCKQNALVDCQISALKAYRRLINGLPDGYPMPMEGEGK